MTLTRPSVTSSPLSDGEELRLQVRTDRACGIGTLMARYGWSWEDTLHHLRASGISVAVTNIEAVRGRLSTMGPYLIAHVGSRPDMDDLGLAHYAGLAGMRLTLRATPASWRHASAGDRPSGRGVRQPDTNNSKPDAYMLISGGRLVRVEYDRRTYDNATIERKLLASMEATQHIVWGCAVPRRLAYVRDAFERLLEARAAESRRVGLSTPIPVSLITLPVHWHVWSEA